MSSTSVRLRRASSSLSLLKHDVYKISSGFPGINSVATTLTPDLQQPLPKPLFSTESTLRQIGDYLLISELTSSSHSPVSSFKTFEAVNISTQQKFICKVLPFGPHKDYLSSYYRVGSHDHIAQLHQVIVGASSVYAFFPRHYGDLHSHIRTAKRLKDTDAAQLFAQIVSVVEHCHDAGVVLRDLKLRKFVFKNAEKTELMLENLDDACVLCADATDDQLSDRHGCPAYVSPEILAAADSTYSGFAADVWSLGVVLYTMLVGRYPFHDADPVALFRMIRQCRYVIPRRMMSEQVECLLRWILRSNPQERPAANEILLHPWFELCRRSPSRVNRYYNEKQDNNSRLLNRNDKERGIDLFVGSDASNDQSVPQGTLNGSIIDLMCE